MKIFRNIVKPAWVYTTTVMSLISGLSCSIANAFNVKILTPVAFILFCFSISAILTQLLYAISICNENFENMEAKNSSILLPSCTDQIQNELTNLLKDYTEDAHRIMIICYGTSGYNNTIDQIYNKVFNRQILLEVMVCSPDVVFQNSHHDKEKINDFIKEINVDPNIKFFYSKYLPTIRGCVVYNKKDEPIWNCVQTYCYTESNVSSARYDKSYAIVGRKENACILKNSAEIIENEFKRLQTTKQPLAK